MAYENGLLEELKEGEIYSGYQISDFIANSYDSIVISETQCAAAGFGFKRFKVVKKTEAYVVDSYEDDEEVSCEPNIIYTIRQL